MQSVERAQLCESLQQRRDSIATSWERSIASISHTSLHAIDTCQPFTALTDQLLNLLLAESVDRAAVQAIGAALARVGDPDPALLSSTLELLTNELLADVPTELVGEFRHRLATLLGAFAAGFYGQARETLLAEQEQRRQALLADRAQVEAALRESQELLRAVVTHFPIVLFTLDASGIFTLAAGKGLDGLNLSADTIVGRSIDDVAGGLPDVLSNVRRALSGEAFAATVRVDARVYETWYEPLRDANGVCAGVIGVAADATDHARAVDALRASEIRYRTLVEQLPAISYVAALDATSSTHYTSPQIERLLGFSQAEWMADPELWIKRLHPDDRERVLRDVAVAQTSGQAIPSEFRMLTRDGDVVWFRDAAQVVRNEGGEPLFLQGVMLDITDQKHMEHALRMSEARFRATFDGAGIGVALVDADGRLLESNRALQRLLGYSADELRTMTFAEITHPDDVLVDQEQYRELLTGRRDSYQLIKRYMHCDGDVVWGRLTVSLIPGSDGAPPVSIGMVEDISEQKRAADELTETRRQLVASRESERLHLARDLHDGPMQDLYGVQFRLGKLAESIPDEAHQAGLAAVQAMLEPIIDALRTTCTELRPPAFTQFGLTVGMHALATGVQETHRTLTLHLDLAQDGERLPGALQLAVFRVYQEALRNVVRHAQAQQLWVRLLVETHHVMLEVEDDGRGFTVRDDWNALARQGHFGLLGIAEQVALLEGQFMVHSSGHGTLVRVVLPLKES
jgi:PAS domain S-box-containing protein